jgi:hypothetical protein
MTNQANTIKALRHYARLVREMQRTGGNVLIEDRVFQGAWQMRADDEMPAEVLKYYDEVRKHSGFMPEGWAESLPDARTMAETLGIDLNSPEHVRLSREI